MSNGTQETSTPPVHPQPVQPSARVGDLIDEMVGYLNRYISLPDPELAVVIACWIANTYIYKEFRYCGYLTLRSATPRCGKTRLLRLIGALAQGAPKPMTIPTAAAIFRNERKVLLLDEVDHLRNQDRESYGAVLAVLNAGFEQDGIIERTERTEDGNFVVRSFPVFGPKAFAGIEGLADALADRAFMIQMTRSVHRVPRLNMSRMDFAFSELRTKLGSWANQNAERIRTAYQQLPDEIAGLSGYDDRFQDISEPLTVLATSADTERPDGPLVLPRLLDGLRIAAGRRTPSTRERGLIKLLEVVKRVIRDGQEEDFIQSSSLVQACRETDELGWITSAKALAGFLSHFDLSPRQSPDGRCRGYFIRRDWVRHWEERYGNSLAEPLRVSAGSPILSAQPVEASESQASSEDSTLVEASEQQEVLTH